MESNNLSRLRKRAKKHRMVIHADRNLEGYYRLVDVSDSKQWFYAFGRPVNLEEIEERLDWLEEKK